MNAPVPHAGGRQQALGLVALVVREYEEALQFYVGTLGFELVEDTPVPAQGKRWVVVRPPGHGGASLLLARASAPEQGERVGDQAGGRVFLFLYTDDIDRDCAAYRARGVRFVREPQVQPHGKVAVFADLYGNLWDLIQPTSGAPRVNVRFAGVEDAPAIASVHVDAWRQAYAGVLPQETLDGLSVEARTRMWSQAIAGTRGRVLVAHEGGNILGFAAFGPCRDAGAPAMEHELWAIYVAPDRWRRGAGRALWAGARRAMVSAGAADISVWVLARNQRARTFYESLGLRAVSGSGQRAITVGGTPVDEVRYVLHVADATTYDYP